MTYQTERASIEAYFIAQWAGATPLGMDGQEFTPVAPSVQLTIASGAALQGSVGRVLDRIDYIGTLTATIYTDGASGSSAWRGYAETIIGFLHGVTLDNAGAVITSTADAFVRFSPPGISGQQHPYIGASFKAAPFHQTNVIAPFTRYEFR